MYGLPKDYDVSFLIERELESICFAQYQINLNFTGTVWIQIEGKFKHFDGDKLIEQVEEFPISQSALLQTLGQKITAVNFTTDGDLELVLSKKNRIFIMGDNGAYESYRIFDGQKETII
jgi:hypothetical protein